MRPRTLLLALLVAAAVVAAWRGGALRRKGGGGGAGGGGGGGAGSVRHVHLVFSNHLDVGFGGIRPQPGFDNLVLDKYFHEYFPRAIAVAAELRARGGPERLVYLSHVRGWVCGGMRHLKSHAPGLRNSRRLARPHPPTSQAPPPHTHTRAAGFPHQPLSGLPLACGRHLPQRHCRGGAAWRHPTGGHHLACEGRELGRMAMHERQRIERAFPSPPRAPPPPQAMPHNAQVEVFDPDLLQFAVRHTHEALDDAFHLPRKLTMSQRDVPGLSRAAVPLLWEQGVRALSGARACVCVYVCGGGGGVHACVWGGGARARRRLCANYCVPTTPPHTHAHARRSGREPQQRAPRRAEEHAFLVA